MRAYFRNCIGLLFFLSKHNLKPSKATSLPILLRNLKQSTTLFSGEKIFIFGKGGGERLARESGVPFLGAIPLDPEVCRCGDTGQSLLERQDLIAAKAFQEVTDRVVVEVDALKAKSGGHLQGFNLAWKEMA